MIRSASDPSFNHFDGIQAQRPALSLNARALQSFIPSAGAPEWKPSQPPVQLRAGHPPHLGAGPSLPVRRAKEREREAEHVLLRPLKLDETDFMKEAVRLGDIKIYKPADFESASFSYIAPKNCLPPRESRLYKIFCGQLGPTSKVQYLVLNVIGEITSVTLYDVKEKGRNCRVFAVEGEPNRDEVLSWSKGLRCTDSNVYVALTKFGRRILQEMGSERGGPEHPVTIELEHSEMQREENRLRHRKVHPGAGSPAGSPTSASPTGMGPMVGSPNGTNGVVQHGGAGKTHQFSPVAAPFVPGAGYRPSPKSPTEHSQPSPSSPAVPTAVAHWPHASNTLSGSPIPTATPVARCSRKEEAEAESLRVASILDQLRESSS